MRLWIGALLVATSCVVYGEGDGSGSSSSGGSSGSDDASTERDASPRDGGLNDASTGGDDDGGANDGSTLPALTAEEQAMLNAANAYRANLSPTPEPPLPPLVWFYDAVPLMEPWALGCEAEKNRRQAGAATRYSVAQSGLSAAQFVEQLGSGYDYSANTCEMSNCVVPKALRQRTVTQFACVRNQCGANDFRACAFAPDFDIDGRPY